MGRRAAIAGAVLAVLAPVWFVGCGQPIDPWADEPGSPRVVVSIAPLASWVRAVGGDRVAIQCLCTTTGPHHFQADTRDARLFEKADVFFSVGLKLDDQFADSLVTLARRPDLPHVKLGERLPQASLLTTMAGAHSHGKYDPHVWLGIAEAVAMVGQVRDELARVDPANASGYAERAEKYVRSLRQLHADGKQKLHGAKVKRVITFHAALAYFARSFDLEIAAVIEEGPGDEPTPKHLAKLIDLCQDTRKPIGAITVEPQYPATTSAAIIGKELKKQGIVMPLVEVDPLETADAARLRQEGAGWYEVRMRQNVQALADALK